MGLPGCIRQTHQEPTTPGRSVSCLFVCDFGPVTFAPLCIDLIITFCVILAKKIRQMQLAVVQKL